VIETICDDCRQDRDHRQQWILPAAEACSRRGKYYAVKTVHLRSKKFQGPPLCDQQSPKSGDDTPLIEPQQITVDHLRRAADSWLGPSDPELMAKEWDESATPDVQPATNSPRRFGQLENLAASDNFDDPLPDTEIAAWEDDLPS
jgi:hypothetical protein